MKPKFLKVVPSPENSFDVNRAISCQFNTPWHFHPELELNFLVSSSGTRFVGNHIGRFAPGDLVLLGPNLPHLWKNDATCNINEANHAEAVNVRFSLAQLDFLSRNLPEFSKVSKMIERSNRGIIFLGKKKKFVIDLMMKMLEQKGLSKLISLLTTLNHLSEIKEYQLLSDEGFTVSGRGNPAKRMNTIYDYVLTNFDKEISLKAAAAIVFMNPSSFSRFFKMTSGKSFTDFVIETKLSHACKMLLETDLSITQIMYACGFNNQSNFNILFNKKLGTKPLTYRKKYAR